MQERTDTVQDKMENLTASAGSFMIKLMQELYPIPRSLTGQGVLDTLAIIRREIPELEIYSIESGANVFDWIIPREWNVNEAWILDPSGNIVCDFRDNFLHLVGYSDNVSGRFSLNELQKHLFSREDLPTAIPYVTSYYDDFWGFCLSHSNREALQLGTYTVKIDVEKKPGHLHFADLVLPGDLKDEILLSTYICHPNMANNELSGIVLAVALYKFLSEIPNRRYTYRIVFVPETIGTIAYLDKKIIELKERIVAGFVLTCVGDERTYSFLPSRQGDTLADRVALTVLSNDVPVFDSYSWLSRGSDERQYCAPNVNLPVCSVMRSKYGTYPEYHTSLDDIGGVVTEGGLQGSFDVYTNLIMLLENNFNYISTTVGEPFLSKRNLFANRGTNSVDLNTKNLLDLISYADGKSDLITIAKNMKIKTHELLEVVQIALAENLVRK